MKDQNPMAEEPQPKPETSKELLFINGDGSRKTVIKSLMKEKKEAKRQKESLNTFKMERSPLLNHLESFLPQLKDSNSSLMKMSDEERKQLDIEDVEGCSKVVEMDVLFGQMAESSSSESEDEENIAVTKIGKKLEEVKRRDDGKDLVTEVTSNTSSKPDSSLI